MSDLTRHQATILLLQTLHDAEPAPPTSTGRMVASSAVPGPGPGRKGPCPTCKGHKRLLGPTESRHPCHRCHNQEHKPHGCRNCNTCHGAGKVDYDSVLNAPLASLLGKPRGMTSRELEHGAKRAGAIVAAKEGRCIPGDSFPSDALDVAAQAAGGDITRSLLRRYDYDPLLRAMDLLRGHDERLWRRVRARWVTGGATVWAGRARERRMAEADLGLAFLVARMPDPVRVPEWLTAEFGRARRLRVEAMLGEGASVAECALAEGLGDTRVRSIRKAWLHTRQVAA